MSFFGDRGDWGKSLAGIHRTDHHILLITKILPSWGLAFPYGSADKEPTYNAGDLDSIPGFGRSPGEGKGYPLQYYGLEKSVNCKVHGVAKSRTQLSDFHFTAEATLQWVFTWGTNVFMFFAYSEKVITRVLLPKFSVTTSQRCFFQCPDHPAKPFVTVHE